MRNVCKPLQETVAEHERQRLHVLFGECTGSARLRVLCHLWRPRHHGLVGRPVEDRWRHGCPMCRQAPVSSPVSFEPLAVVIEELVCNRDVAPVPRLRRSRPATGQPHAKASARRGSHTFLSAISEASRTMVFAAVAHRSDVCRPQPSAQGRRPYLLSRRADAPSAGPGIRQSSDLR